MIQIAVVVDEISYADQLCNYLRQYEIEHREPICVQVFSSCDAIFECVPIQYQIILVDMGMFCKDDMDTTEKIHRMNKEVFILFIANIKQYAVRGYVAETIDYALTPSSYFTFTQKFSGAITYIKRNRWHV